MYSFYLFTVAFALSQIALALVKILTPKGVSLAEAIFSLFLLCVAIYLSQPLMNNIDLPIAAQLFWQHIPTAIPALFLLCCATIFDDEFEFSWFFALPLALSVLPPFFYDVLVLRGYWFNLILVSLPQYLEFLLLLWGLWIIAVSWRSDLVEKRRHFRFITMSVAGSIILLVISAQQFSNLSEAQIDLLHYPIACLFLFCLNTLLLDVSQRVTLFQYKEAIESVQKESDSFSPEWQALQSLMLEERIYRNEALSLATVAQALGLPEYKTRALINQQMGFRNFNAFLNHYRIAEAAERLSNDQGTITDIAYALGYNSLSAFNRAFRQIHQKTPSEYRRRYKKY